MSIAASAIVAVSLLAIFRYGLADGWALALVSAAYVVAGLWSFRRPLSPGSLPRWTVPAGVAVAALELTNISLEQFVGLPAPANAVVPASMMALLVLAASTAAVAASAGATVLRGIATAVLVVGLGMLLSVDTVLLFVAVRAVWPPHDIPLLGLTCANATMHLTLPLLLAAVAGAAAAAISAGASLVRSWIPALISIGGVAVLVIGVRLLVRAASLPRAERPSLVLPGMALSALGLVLLPCVLGRRHPPLQNAADTPARSERRSTG